MSELFEAIQMRSLWKDRLLEEALNDLKPVLIAAGAGTKPELKWKRLMKYYEYKQIEHLPTNLRNVSVFLCDLADIPDDKKTKGGYCKSFKVYEAKAPSQAKAEDKLKKRWQKRWKC
ncbi:hypothetical protein ACTXT7_013993 [Hymenolepis weldensis]